MLAAVRDYKQVSCADAARHAHVFFQHCIKIISSFCQDACLFCQLPQQPVAKTSVLQDMEHQDAADRQQQYVRDVDIDDLLDDPELERLHAERLATMQRENEKRQQLQRKGHGEYQEVEEGQQQFSIRRLAV